MLKYETYDITITRGIVFEQEFRLFDEGYTPVPVDAVRSWSAAVYLTDAIDGTVLGTFTVSVLDDVDTTVLVSMPQNVTQSLTQNRNAGYWYFYYVDDATGDRIPIKKGKVSVE